MLRSRTAVVPFLALALAFTTVPQITTHYDLKHPSKRFTLPAELTEVSALTDIDANTVACLQDEEGAIYLVDLGTGKVTGKSVTPSNTPSSR